MKKIIIIISFIWSSNIALADNQDFYKVPSRSYPAEIIDGQLVYKSNHTCLPKVHGQCAELCRKDGYRSGYCKGSRQSTGVCICS